MTLNTTLIAVALLVSLIACVAKTKRDKESFPKNITVAGWLLAALAVVTAGINYWQSQKAAFANSIEESLALRRLETAIYTLMIPSTAISDAPELKDRFQIVAGYGDAGAISGLCDLIITEPVKSIVVAPQFNGLPWGDFITETASDGLSQIRQAQSAYGRVLGDDVNLLIGEVLAHPWNEFLLAAKGRRIRRPESNQPICLAKPESAHQKYIDLANRYWKTLARLETIVGLRYCKLRTKLHIADVPPLFLRFVSGLFFVPDTEKTEPIMEQVCKGLNDKKR